MEDNEIKNIAKEYINKHEAYLLLKQKAETYMLPATKEAYEGAARLIDSIKTCDVQPINDWISVKDRLPDDEKRYLICTESRRDKIEIAYYQPIGDKFSDYEPFWQGDSCRFTTSVTHWQPLPKRPKEV